MEIRHVLNSFYGFDKKQILNGIREFLSLSFIQILSDYTLYFEKVIDLNLNNNLSLVDYLYLQICLENDLRLVTFDKKMKREFEELVRELYNLT